LLIFDGENSKQSVWIMSYPPGGNPPPHVIEKRPSFGTYLFGASWMPDGRHIVVSLIGYQNSSTHLWMADTESSDLTPLTSGGSNEQFPAVAPDGKRVLFTQHNYFLNVTSLSIKDGSATTLISTGRSESMADWSANQPKLVWVSNRSGPYDIWVRQPDGVERPVITAADFPPGTCRVLLNPVLSPDGDRIVYQMLDSSGANRLWISSLSGGVPVRLTNVEPLAEFAGSWSPDGRRFVYLQVAGGEWQLMIVKTSGSAAPTLLKDMGPDSPDVSDLPDWSPTGSWITYHGGNGWHLISPDGKSSKSLGKIRTPYLSFAKDGKLLYGIQAGGPGSDQNRATFFSLDPITLKQKVIKELGKDYVPPISFRPSVRFSLSSDGKSLVYSTGKENWDLWMLEGLAQPSWVDRIRSWAGK
jgi:Tol biopolymer transport system component